MNGIRLFLTGCFADLSCNMLVLVTDTLAVVRLWRTESANLSRYLADHLLVSTAYNYGGLSINLQLNSGWRIENYRMTVA